MGRLPVTSELRDIHPTTKLPSSVLWIPPTWWAWQDINKSSQLDQIVALPGLGRGSPGRGPGAGSSAFGCVRGPGGAGGGGLGGRWVVCRCAGRCTVWVVVFPRFGGFCLPIGLVWSYDTRSVRGDSIHTLSLSHSPLYQSTSYWTEPAGTKGSVSLRHPRFGGHFTAIIALAMPASFS